MRLEVVGVDGGPEKDPAHGTGGCLSGMREATGGWGQGPSIRPSCTIGGCFTGDRWTRAERFDGVFFVDLPGRDQKDAIGAIYTRHHGLDAQQARPDDANWTGAEIKSCCRLASLLEVPLVQAAQNVVPVVATAGDKIKGVRQWTSGRCLSADRAGVYSQSEAATGGRVRRVVREPGVN